MRPKKTKETVSFAPGLPAREAVARPARGSAVRSVGAGLNDSMVHVDFMIGSADMMIEGLCEDGKIVPIFINGNWAN